MPALKTYDLFISHAWKYGDDYNRLIDLLYQAPNFRFRNYSAPENKPLHIGGDEVSNATEIQLAIQRKIAPVNCVLVISGMYYNNRKWMQHEIDTARRMHKPIIAIYPWGNSRIPYEISDAADCFVHWNTDGIVSAIRTHSI